MEKKRRKRNVGEELAPLGSVLSSLKDLVPVFFDLPRTFFNKLRRTSERTGVQPEVLLQRGLDLACEEAERVLRESKGLNVAEKTAKAGKARWAQVRAEERSQKMKELAQSRWKKPDEKDS